jgi:hypothetical protein
MPLGGKRNATPPRGHLAEKLGQDRHPRRSQLKVTTHTSMTPFIAAGVEPTRQPIHIVSVLYGGTAASVIGQGIGALTVLRPTPSAASNDVVSMLGTPG